MDGWIKGAFFAAYALGQLPAGYLAGRFGWANMWGNMGAAIGIWVLPFVIRTLDRNGDWHEGLLFCAAAFVIAGLFCLGFNAEDRVEDAA
jgi:MFS family permease